MVRKSSIRRTLLSLRAATLFILALRPSLPPSLLPPSPHLPNRFQLFRLDGQLAFKLHAFLLVHQTTDPVQFPFTGEG